MSSHTTFTSPLCVPKDLEFIKKLVYDKCGFEITNFTQNIESIDYGACSFLLNGKTIQQRTSKITPTKTGQFVTLWKRNKEGITTPFDSTDNLDLVIILSRSGNNFGQFIFPKHVLVEKGIISQNGRGGKRGFRVYPPWDNVNNKQAEKTQSWQTRYFITIHTNNANNLDVMKQLFA